MKIRDWLTSQLRNVQVWFKRRAVRRLVQGLLLTIAGSSSLLFIEALYRGARLQWIILTGGITLICLSLILPLNWQGIRNLVLTISYFIWNNRKVILTVVLVSGVIAVIQYLWTRPPAPSAFPERQIVDEIQYLSSKSDTEKWTAVKENSEASKTIFLIRNYELIEATNSEDMVKKIYIKDGKKIAEDARGPEPYSYSRKYYHGDCNFAIDYLDGSLRCVLTEYRKDCEADFKKFKCDSTILIPPPPVPVFTYR